MPEPGGADGPPQNRRGGTGDGPRRPAYQQLADEIRSQILSGSPVPGERLPGEAELCKRHGVSRSTVREAIRLLEAQQLVVTTRGTTGGSFVALPTAARIENELGTSLDLLVVHETLSVEEILEVRRLLEVPATELAATRRSEDDLADLRSCVAEGRGANERFHAVLLRASGNPLIEVMTRPLFSVLRARILREHAPEAFWEHVDHDHQVILDMVEAGEAEAAGDEMRAHLQHLAGAYRRLDRSGSAARGEGV